VRANQLKIKINGASSDNHRQKNSKRKRKIAGKLERQTAIRSRVKIKRKIASKKAVSNCSLSLFNETKPNNEHAHPYTIVVSIICRQSALCHLIHLIP